MKRTLALALMLSVLALVSVAAIAKASPDASKSAANGKVYVCDKCDAAFDHPGKCPCGRELKAVDKSDIYYQCPGCKAVSDKPGKCPKCNVDMKLHVKSWEKAAAAAPAKG